jgi:hypothetical protein
LAPRRLSAADERIRTAALISSYEKLRGGSTPSSVITNRMTSSTVIVRRSGEAFEAARARGHVMPLEG